MKKLTAIISNAQLTVPSSLDQASKSHHRLPNLNLLSMLSSHLLLNISYLYDKEVVIVLKTHIQDCEMADF